MEKGSIIKVPYQGELTPAIYEGTLPNIWGGFLHLVRLKKDGKLITLEEIKNDTPAH